MAPCFAISSIRKNMVNQTGKHLKSLVFCSIFCKIRFRKMNYSKHEEALSYLRGIREERGLLSAFIFTIVSGTKLTVQGREGPFCTGLFVFLIGG